MPESTLTPAPIVAAPPTTGGRVQAVDVSQHAGRRQLLDHVTLTVEPGELVALMGPSGAGKTTLLEVLAGTRRPSGGVVRHDGRLVDATVAPARAVGVVPQDDIIHVDLPLRRTLRYAARLRLPGRATAAQVDRVVDRTLGDLGLTERADVVVRRLSGGQRKRASIAVELLAAPSTLFLDEPTSGLDPSTAAGVVSLLRRLAADGTTVVFTTHDPSGLDACDRVVFLARGGQLAFAGTPDEARAFFGVHDLRRVFDRLDEAPSVPAPHATAQPSPEPPPRAARPPRHTPGELLRQCWVLARRNADTLVRNRLTLAVLVGSPVLVTVMLAMLFQRGAFAASARADLGPAQVVFWVAFSGFFFGLTYGLLQIVGELPVVRREWRSGLSSLAYVVAKALVLTPVLAIVTAVLLGVLRVLDRLPDAGWQVYGSLFVTLVVEEVAALTLGLLASAAVSTSAQAALALPMLCFPQVLFAGAVVPVDDMAGSGQALSRALANRYAFEALGADLRLDQLAGTVPSLRGYGQAFAGPVGTHWLLLAGLAVVCGLAAVRVLDRRCRSVGQRSR